MLFIQHNSSRKQYTKYYFKCFQYNVISDSEYKNQIEGDENMAIYYITLLGYHFSNVNLINGFILLFSLVAFVELKDFYREK